MTGCPLRLVTISALISAIAFAVGSEMLHAQERTVFSVLNETGGHRVRIQGNWQPGQNYAAEYSTDLVTWYRVSPVMQPNGSVLDWGHKQYTFSAQAASVISLFSDTILSKRVPVRFYRFRKHPTALTTDPVGATTPIGRLTQSSTGTKPFTYTSATGWTITVDLSTITIISSDGKASSQHWGAPVHENFNGKHMKDWLGTSRTVILPGNAMITMKTNTPTGVVAAVSIYDVDQTHKINTLTNTVITSTSQVRVGEVAEPDGETMNFIHIGGGRYYMENIYTQNSTGDGTDAVQEEIPIGNSGGDANPNQLNDYYNDPRLAHT